MARQLKTSEDGIRAIRFSEGTALFRYICPAGLPTIGVGHMLTRSELSSGKIIINGEPVKYGNGITFQQADALLAQDLAPTEAAIRDGVKVKLSQGQFDALVSFTFNVGVGAFQRSTLLRLLNEGRYRDVPAQLRRWVLVNGRKSEGLAKRREREVAMWERGD